MKVVNIITQMEAGGAQQAAMNIAGELRERGYDAEVWFLYVKRPTYLGCRGIRAILNYQPARVMDYVRILWGLFILLLRQKPAVVISHTYYANVLGQTAARLAGVRGRLAVQHNPSSTYPRLARWLDLLLGSMSFYTSNIVVSTAALRDVLAGDGDAPVGILIPPGDELGFVRAVKTVLEDGPLAGLLADRSKAGAKDYSLARMVESYEQCFLETAYEAG